MPLIPNNAPALWAYYLGVFSLIPIVGLPLGVGAVIAGIQGVRLANKNPGSKGKGHAWTGIIMGGICTVLWTVALIFVLAY